MNSSSDGPLLKIIDQAMATAAQLSGSWVVCRPGCSACCHAPFAISPLDAGRLRDGLACLEAADPPRAARVRERARAWIERAGSAYPGDVTTGILRSAEWRPDEFDALGDDPCPVLDPETATCDLYAWRPIPCRTFGAAIRNGDGSISACDLCYQGASDAEIAACAVEVDPENLESRLLAEFAGGASAPPRTTVAFCFIR